MTAVLAWAVGGLLVAALSPLFLGSMMRRGVDPHVVLVSVGRSGTRNCSEYQCPGDLEPFTQSRGRLVADRIRPQLLARPSRRRAGQARDGGGCTRRVNPGHRGGARHRPSVQLLPYPPRATPAAPRVAAHSGGCTVLVTAPGSRFLCPSPTASLGALRLSLPATD